MSQRWRLAAGGRINRSRPIRFFFNGRVLTGYEGDTLASALIANGIRTVARSFKYHRPRGIVGVSLQEPEQQETNGKQQHEQRQVSHVDRSAVSRLFRPRGSGSNGSREGLRSAPRANRICTAEV